MYSGRLKLNGGENEDTLQAAFNYALSLNRLERYQEVKSLLHKTVPVALRTLGDGHELSLRLRWTYAAALYADPSATLDDLREAVTTLEDTERTARRVLGGSHPTTEGLEVCLRDGRAALRARETPSPGSS